MTPEQELELLKAAVREHSHNPELLKMVGPDAYEKGQARVRQDAITTLTQQCESPPSPLFNVTEAKEQRDHLMRKQGAYEARTGLRMYDMEIEELATRIEAMDKEYEDAGILSRQNDEAISSLAARIEALERRLNEGETADKWNKTKEALWSLYKAFHSDDKDFDEELDVLMEMYENSLD